jgi:hypothetical protein
MNPNDTIFVSVASYRDRQCHETVHDLFEKASFPDRIRVGVCEQHDPADVPCGKGLGKWAAQVKIYYLPPEEAKGPTYARYWCATLMNNEDYFLQIDAHTRFVPSWDIYGIAMIKQAVQQAGHPKVILSYYPADMKDYKKKPDDKSIPRIETASLSRDGIWKWDAAIYRPTGDKLEPGKFIAAGCLFTTKQWVKDVPFDPNLPFLFTGEEVLLTARSYTKGWDIYSPNRHLIFHSYYRSEEPKIWDTARYNPGKAKKRLFQLLDPGNAEAFRDTYGMGTQRPLVEFFNSFTSEKQLFRRQFSPAADPLPLTLLFLVGIFCIVRIALDVGI